MARVRTRKAPFVAIVLALAEAVVGCGTKALISTDTAETAGLSGTSTGEPMCNGVPAGSQYCFGVHKVPNLSAPLAAIGGEIDDTPGEHVVMINQLSGEIVTVSFAAPDFIFSEPVVGPVWTENRLYLSNLDDDSHLDLVVTSVSGPSGYLPNLGGIFGSPQEFTFPDVPGAGRLSPIDVNADDRAELLRGHNETAHLWKLEGDTWTLQTPSFDIPNCYTYWDSAIADFNQDGASDIAFIGSPASWTMATEFCSTPPEHGVKVLLSNLETTILEEVASIPTVQSVNQIAAGDFDGDSIVDLALSSELDNAVIALRGTGTGQFMPAQVVSAGVRVLSGDFDGDGVDEIASNRYSDDSLKTEVWLIDDVLSNPSGVRVDDVNAEILTVADLNDDGVDDIAARNFGDGPSHLLVLMSKPLEP